METEKTLSLEEIKQYNDRYWLWYLSQNPNVDVESIRSHKEWLIKTVEQQQKVIEKYVLFLHYCADVSLDKRIAGYAKELLVDHLDNGGVEKDVKRLEMSVAALKNLLHYLENSTQQKEN